VSPYLLVGVHAGEAAAVARLAALGGDVTDLFLGAGKGVSASRLGAAEGGARTTYRLAKLPGLVF
jgi:hypothetical protein